MRLVTEKALRAFLNGKNTAVSNTMVADDRLYLFGNCIAKIEDGKLFVRIYYNSNTTRERLNGFSEFGYNIRVTQKNWMPFINGKEVTDEMAWVEINKKA